MGLKKVEKQFREVCNAAGLEVNGYNDRDPQIENPSEFYRAFAKNPYLALGEAFAAEHLDVEDLEGMVMAFVKAQMKGALPDFSFKQKVNLISYFRSRRILNPQKKGSKDIGKSHYDVGNDLISAMTGRLGKYTSGYWPSGLDGFDLNKAQELDVKIICERLGLKEGMHVLDIGFGLGKISRYMIENYGVFVTGLTVSEEQRKLAKKHCKDISGRYNFILSSWDDMIPEQFDRIVSIEMIEHVGPNNYSDFFEFIYNSLTENGSALIQAINSSYGTYANNPFIDKYIFRYGVTPKVDWMIGAAVDAGLRLRLLDNSLGEAYSETLNAWWVNSQHALKSLNDQYRDHFKDIFPHETNDNTFSRIWQFYLLSCAAGFRSGLLQDGHFVFEKNPKNVSKQDIYIPRTRAEINSYLR
jgi:cyclopropane-fatty-acyl-phospholipid synthase